MTEEIASTTEEVATDAVIEATDATLLSAEAPEAPVEIEYTDFTYPEGTVVDETIQDAFKSAAKEAGLTQKQAQHLTDMGGLMRTKVMADHQAQQAQVHNDWAEASRSDIRNGDYPFHSRRSQWFAPKFTCCLLLSSEQPWGV